MSVCMCVCVIRYLFHTSLYSKEENQVLFLSAMIALNLTLKLQFQPYLSIDFLTLKFLSTACLM